METSKATKECKNCKSSIPKDASKCKHCGSTQPRHFWKGPWFYVFLFILGAQALPSFLQDRYNIPQSDYELVQPDSNAAKNSLDVAQSKWLYRTIKDEIDDTNIKIYGTESTNTLYFDFPYNGGTNFALTIREIGGKQDVLLSCTNKCQFIHSGVYDTEKLRIRVDDKDFVNYGFTQPADYSTDMVFISSPETLIQAIKQAKTLKIEAPFYREGHQVISFDVEGLEMD